MALEEISCFESGMFYADPIKMDGTERRSWTQMHVHIECISLCKPYTNCIQTVYIHSVVIQTMQFVYSLCNYTVYAVCIQFV